ncbi:hypothetical protein NDU88_005460 [Pleurodeles waltl]|uniref:Uncharacterized protein n=1 Tax=Pleurodeles waltl TaxID=8319 RepID=A0AAV7NWQ4_PLEWA|nr:hypothetical protein NDU88_005460 [Pleurodeles waltl]
MNVEGGGSKPVADEATRLGRSSRWPSEGLKYPVDLAALKAKLRSVREPRAAGAPTPILFRGRGSPTMLHGVSGLPATLGQNGGRKSRTEEAALTALCTGAQI